MNRSILIVICDFLLVSLLAFSTVDINKVADPTAQRNLKLEPATNSVETDKDLAAVMRLALEQERQNRDQLVGELTRSRENAARTQAQLGEREKQVQTFQQELQTREQQAAQLQQAQANLQQAQASLQQQYAAAQTNLQTLNQQLQGTTTEATISRQKLAEMEAELRKQAERAAAMQNQMAELARSNQFVLSEKQRLAGELQVAEVEKRHAAEQAARLQDEVKTEREEKAKLADGVKALATRSGQLAQEIRENRALAPNTIFEDFLTNRVQASFTAVRSGFFGDSSKAKETQTVLVTDGTNTFALCHVDDTPLGFGSSGTEWSGLAGMLTRNMGQCAIRSVAFCWPDPRVVLIPVTADEARRLGGKVYQVSAAPYKFQDAVLVGAREGYYGECRFQIDLATPEYVKLDNSFLRGLFGKFNPSRGDLVFSKSGELLGMMANGTYCLMLRKFDATATFKFGRDVRDQHTGETLSRLYSFVSGLPPKLQ
jgi:hypothetical protein